MCELFALSARQPASVRLSFPAFARHGGGSDHHADGWGVAFFQGPRAQVLCEPEPAADSALVGFLVEHAWRSQTVISHIRRATQGAVALENTQPFRRSLGGRDHVFAHNGHLVDPRGMMDHRGFHRPIGDTDSERAFCSLLAMMEPLWGFGMPSVQARVDVVTAFAGALRPLGPANFLYSDGELIFAHGHRRTQRPSRQVRPPGLHMLARTCSGGGSTQAWPGVNVHSGPSDQSVVLFASVPLSDEPWVELGEGALVVARDGVVLARVNPEGTRECLG